MKCLFDNADADSDGVVTVEELEALLARHGVGDARAPRFVYYDDDNNKRIDKEEVPVAAPGREGLLTYEMSNTVSAQRVSAQHSRSTAEP